MTTPVDPPTSEPIREGLAEIVRVADLILALVGGAAPGWSKVSVRDENDSFMLAAHARAFRCFRAIRALASPPWCDSDHADVLTRSLVSLLAVSGWLVAPADDAERNSRFERWLRTSTEDGRKALIDQKDQGFDVLDLGIEIADKAIAMYDRLGVKRMPNERDLCRSLDLLPVYATVYRSSSAVAHHSLNVAEHTGFLERPIPGELEGRRVALDAIQPAQAEQSLTNAAATYLAFLRLSEPIVHHGVERPVFDAIMRYSTAYGPRSARAVQTPVQTSEPEKPD